MKTLYLDCGMGAAGDMLSAALIELFPDKKKIEDELNAIGIPNVRFSAETSVKCGITGTYMHVSVHGEEEHMHSHSHEHEHAHHHSHSGIEEITHIISSHLKLSDIVKKDALKVFQLLAQAESHVHGIPVTDIHFHEVGTMDAVADIVCVCYLLHKLDVQKIIASPVQTGSGHVHCAHGILPVPAPATAFLLTDIPICSGEIQSELCTPTGAALLKYFVHSFENMPVMCPTAIGYGMGKKDFQTANCVRAILGETADLTDCVLELSCNLDDMTGEEISFAAKKLFECGALDVLLIPIYMKKGRPGTLLQVLCKPSDKDSVLQMMFRHTTTLGIREATLRRYTLDRKLYGTDTKFGTVHSKESFGYGVHRLKYEADDLECIANEQGCSLRDVLNALNDNQELKV